MKTHKSLKRSPEAHVCNTKYGMGDYYGTGIKQPIGRVRADFTTGNPSTSKKMGKPPKSLA